MLYTIRFRLERLFYGPGITAISPTSGPVGTTVTITGAGLVPLVAFQGVPATITNFSPTSITTSVPAGASTGPIAVNSFQTQHVFTVTHARIETTTRSSAPNGPRGAPAGPTATPPRTAPAAPPSTSPCCIVVPNPALAGRLGRLVVAFPANAVPTGTGVVARRNGQEAQAGYGNQAWDLLPGTYELTISGKTLADVTVQARSDTNVRVGVLRVSAASQTRADVVDAGAVIASGYGEQLVGLPAGTYDLRISGQTESFTITEGQVTDF